MVEHIRNWCGRCGWLARLFPTLLALLAVFDASAQSCIQYSTRTARWADAYATAHTYGWSTTRENACQLSARSLAEHAPAFSSVTPRVIQNGYLCEVVAAYSGGCEMGCQYWTWTFATNTSCTYLIALSGPSTTKALPAGPALPQIARVSSSGQPAGGKTVNITVDGISVFSGVTNGEGEVRFTYLPPWLRASKATLKAMCVGCSNTAEKVITVEACEVCTDK